MSSLAKAVSKGIHSSFLDKFEVQWRLVYVGDQDLTSTLHYQIYTAAVAPEVEINHKKVSIKNELCKTTRQK